MGIVNGRASEQDLEDSSPRGKSRTVHRAGLGILSMFTLPFVAVAFPVSSFLATFFLGLKRLAPVPSVVKWGIATSICGIAALWISASLQNTALPTNAMLSFGAVALFLAAGARITEGSQTAAQLVASVGLGTTLFFTVIGHPSTSGSFEHLWKYGIANAVTPAALFVLLFWQRTARFATPALILVGCFSIFTGFRSHGLICFVVVILILVKGRSQRAGIHPFKLVVATGSLIALSVLLPLAISAGIFGQEVRLRSVGQIEDGGPALLAGRVEPPLSVAAIAAKPLFGWGNANAIDADTLSTASGLAYSLGMAPDDYMPFWIYSDGTVSLHSIVLSAWVEGGLVAFLMPFLLMLLFARALWSANGRWLPLVVLVSAQCLWDLLFSPWILNRGVTVAVAAILAAWAIEERHAGSNEPPRSTNGPPRNKLLTTHKAKIAAIDG